MKRKGLAIVLAVGVCTMLGTGCASDTTTSSASTASSSTAQESVQQEVEEVVTTEVVIEALTPLEMLTEGHYTYSYFLEGIGDFVNYFNFYEPMEGFGSVFYAGFCLNQINYTGLYDVQELAYDYACYEGREAAELTTGTAPYTVIFYDWEGNEIDRCGFDGDALYNDMETLTAMGATPNVYNFDNTGEASQYAEAYANEKAMTYLSFIGEDPTSTLTLYHNGTYLDLVNMMVEGSWEMEVVADGSNTFTLTPESSFDAGAVVTIEADKINGVYTSDEGSSVNLLNTIATAPKEVSVMAGEMVIPGTDLMGDMVLSMKDNGTCELNFNAFGNVIFIDEGTYKMATDGFTFEFEFVKAGALSSMIDFETIIISLDYVAEETDLGPVEVSLILDQSNQ